MNVSAMEEVNDYVLMGELVVVHGYYYRMYVLRLEIIYQYLYKRVRYR